MNRPDCRTPSACLAKGQGHCVGCAAARATAQRLATLRADPERYAAWKAAVSRAGRTPEAIAKQVATLKRNRVGRARIAKAGRAHMRRINADPEVMARRVVALKAAVAGRVRRNAERLAARVGIPVALVAEFRFLRWSKHYGQAEAVAHLRALHPAAFAAINEARRLDTLRAAGPAPAIGTPQRAAWTQAVNHAAQSGAPPSR